MEGNDETVAFAALSLQEGNIEEVAAPKEVREDSIPSKEVIAVDAYPYKNKKGARSLIMRSGIGRLKDVQRLLDGGANPNFVSAEGKTALASAVSKGHTQVAEALLKAGANVDGLGMPRWDHYVAVPLIVAAWTDDLEMVKFLLKAGANVNVKDMERRTALYYAAEYGLVDILNALLAAGDGSNKYINGISSDSNPLLAAIRSSRREAVKILINAGANVNVCTVDGRTPLLVEAGRRAPDFELVSLFITRGVDVNALDSDGCSALHYFAIQGCAEICKQLIAAGADVWCRLHLKENESFYAWELVPNHRKMKKDNSVYHSDHVTRKVLKKAMVTRCTAAALSVLGEMPLEIRRRIIRLYKQNKNNITAFTK